MDGGALLVILAILALIFLFASNVLLFRFCARTATGAEGARRAFGELVQAHQRQTQQCLDAALSINDDWVHRKVIERDHLALEMNMRDAAGRYRDAAGRPTARRVVGTDEKPADDAMTEEGWSDRTPAVGAGERAPGTSGDTIDG